MASPQSPILNSGLLYVNGLQMTRDSATTISVASGAARDSSDVNDIILSAAIVLNGAAVGANGMDSDVLANSTMYALYVIGNSSGYKDSAVLASLASNSVPTIPFGYDMYRRIGWFLTDGSAEILRFLQYGSDETRMYYYDEGIQELSNGGEATKTEVDLSLSVPPINTEVLFRAYLQSPIEGEAAYLFPYGSNSVNGFIQLSVELYGPVNQTILMPSQLKSGVPTIEYNLSSGTGTLSLYTLGFKDYL